MKYIGIVYESVIIENLLISSSGGNSAKKGLFVGLAFAPFDLDPNNVSLKVYQIYYQPIATPSSDLAGLNADYYGILVNNLSPSHVLEAQNADTADLYLAQSPLPQNEPKSFEFSDDASLPQLGFSAFLKEALFSHISGTSHLVITGTKFFPGNNAVKLKDPVVSPAYWNLKAQGINQTGAPTASTYTIGNFMGARTMRNGMPCPPSW